MNWLLTSVVLSVVLTVVLNLGVRVFPGGANRVAGRVAQLDPPSSTERRDHDGRRVRVYAPWRTMLIASVVLTIVINVVLRLL